MDQEELRRLIERLQQLHFQRETISAEEQQILQNILHQPPIGGINNTERPAPAAVVETDEAPVVAVAAQLFRIGTHVYITNNISHAGLVRRATRADRAAVVTHHTNTGRVGIRTYNGYRTNRQPENLRLLTLEEQVLCQADRRPR